MVLEAIEMKQAMRKPSKNKIHLGCGRKILEGFVNIDIFDAPGVDLVWDLSLGIPFEDNSFVEAFAIDFVEHIHQNRVIHLINEIYRVLKPGGIFKIHVPESPGITAYQDPTHVSFWNEETFTYFIDGNLRREDYGVYYGIIARFELISLKRKRHMFKKFLSTLNINYLSNYLIDIELRAVK
jgi:SAM-dependent methyltransferase